MRRFVLGTCVTLAALTAPAWGATSDVGVANFQFSPSRVDIQPGDTVTWRFAGPDTDHSVTSDPGQAESFDSDPGNSSPLHRLGDTFSHTFTTPGTYTYFCKVHPFMTGRVVVRAPGTADTTSPQSAARTPWTLFAAIDAPVPVQQQTMPWSARPSATSRAAASLAQAQSSRSSSVSAPCTSGSCPRLRSSPTTASATPVRSSAATATRMAKSLKR